MINRLKAAYLLMFSLITTSCLVADGAYNITVTNLSNAAIWGQFSPGSCSGYVVRSLGTLQPNTTTNAINLDDGCGWYFEIGAGGNLANKYIVGPGARISDLTFDGTQVIVGDMYDDSLQLVSGVLKKIKRGGDEKEYDPTY